MSQAHITDIPGRILAGVTAYAFHPVFFACINLFLLLAIRPHWFGVNSWHDQSLLLVLVAVYTIIIPLISLLMLRALKAISSFHLRERHDRIFPLIISLVFYLWLWINLKQDPAIPRHWIWFVLTAVLSCAVTLVVNNWIKSSLHTTATVATWLFWIIFRISLQSGESMLFRLDRQGLVTFGLDHFLMWLTFITGCVISGRLLMKAHQINEILTGAAIAVIGISAAAKIVF